MHYLVTGHTGFKGAWLSIWLQSQGHTVSGISLDPITGCLYETAGVHELVTNDFRIDIRDYSAIKQAIASIKPDVVIHMAAQPLVRESYKDPRGTIETNAIGTLNILESVSATLSVKAHLVVTTDKVYRNVNQVAGYVEDDPLGGDDPYSASKAMADIVTHSWITSFPGAPTAIARAGNVIGGGDVSPDRLLPDLINSFAAGESPVLRFPQAVRPWQHVLDCLNGYLMICDHLLSGDTTYEAFNIGPDEDSFVSVGEVANIVSEFWGGEFYWVKDQNENPHEAGLLALDAARANETLNWCNKLNFREAIDWTVTWYKENQISSCARNSCNGQIENFLKI